MLDLDSSKELYIFLLSISYGGFLGLLYDINKATMEIFKPKKVLGMLEDLILWMVITLLTFLFLLKHLNGIFRYFVFIGFFMGAFIYLKIFSCFFYPLIIKLFKLIFYLINEIMNIVLYPFRITSNILKRKKVKGEKLFSRLINETRKYFKLVSKKK